ncbi:MAG: adenylyltransferase/sulfurtransferase [Halioglobus sp.]|jgi:adenylyltransferase/sulfurtransferase
MDKSRYVRQTLLSRIGESGQDKLLSSCIAVVGCGGLGSIAAPYLAGAGVGRLILIDGDIPDVSNLHRQVFFFEEPSQKTKATLLAEHINRLNSGIEVIVFNEMISKSNIAQLLDGSDIVLECTDNIQAKYLVNDFCHLNNITVAYGAIYKYDGYVSLFENIDSYSIHLRDIFPIPNDDIPTCSEVGVLGTLAGLIGILQANEAIKYITKAGDSLIGRLLSYDILTNNQMKLKLKKAWDGDITEVFESSSYSMSLFCDVPEISLASVLENRDKYELISILEDDEHYDIDSQVNRQPFSKFNLDNWEHLSDKMHVFYCMSGIRSTQLVLNLSGNKKNVFSLKGGLREYLN